MVAIVVDQHGGQTTTDTPRLSAHLRHHAAQFPDLANNNIIRHRQPETIMAHHKKNIQCVAYTAETPTQLSAKDQNVHRTQ